MLEYVGYFSENLILRRAENGSSLLDVSDLLALPKFLVAKNPTIFVTLVKRSFVSNMYLESHCSLSIGEHVSTFIFKSNYKIDQCHIA